jgi:hypothetical protein
LIFASFHQGKEGPPSSREESKRSDPLQQGKKAKEAPFVKGKKYLAQRAEMKRRAPPSARDKRK